MTAILPTSQILGSGCAISNSTIGSTNLDQVHRGLRVVAGLLLGFLTAPLDLLVVVFARDAAVAVAAERTGAVQRS